MKHLLSLFLFLLVTTASAQPRIEDAILSKKDAMAMFAMSKSKWNKNVLSAASTGQFKAVQGSGGILGMGSRHPGGTALLVKPYYDKGDKKPDLLQIITVFPLKFRFLFSKKSVDDFQQTAKNEMKPEYNIILIFKEEPYGFVFDFFIRETGNSPVKNKLKTNYLEPTE